ncbi:hypothetical protein QFC24_005633 [Naganishia onofrii]|uniref:Uncharacterized protein n=1 Tax=Naganishia onofrii TaxID=1851511 RepID=A0ACC2X7N7_9TREE|nr:hypothetical protein QFC24_005633 [Naganishia onofrii]
MAAAKTERLVVTVGMIGATMATGLCWTELITQAVTHFDNFEANGFIPWTSGLNCFLGGIVVLCVQAVFSYRLIRKAEWKDMQDMNVHVTPFLYTEYGVFLTRMTAFTDIVICVGTLYSLTRMGRAALPQTASRLKKLSYYAIESMVLPTICAALAIILKATRPEGSEHWIFLYLQNKISLIVLLQVLLSREQLTTEAGISIPSSFASSAIRGKPHQFNQATSLTESQLATDSSSALELGLAKA